ncbi:hypothetical protein N7G274_007558 [Stereocaulon virgatum]|uniref:Phospholipid metabolism enzyme regulator n=1 Tax=Stereocaulon virgatum TaxID=373712 RepID=A0ABR4A2H8_9LECA
MAFPAERPNNDEAKAEEKANGDKGPNSMTSSIEKPMSLPPDLKRPSTTSSANPSPRPSREGSPVRPPLKPGTTAGPRSNTSRSRKNSQDLSPARGPGASGPNIPSVPSAAAIQRALATGTPHLPSPAVSDPADAPRLQKANKVSTGGSQSTGSNTPRLRSPPPSASSGLNKTLLSTARSIDQSQSAPTTPAITLERPSRSSTLVSDSDAVEEERTLRAGMRTPVRGMSGNGPTLKTVQESSLPATPAVGTGPSSQIGKTGSNDRPERIDENPMEEVSGKEIPSKTESGNESAGNKSGEVKGVDDGKDKRKPATAPNSAKTQVVQSKKSFSQMPFAKGKTVSEGSVKNMTVETETVSSIPQVALGGGAGERNALGRTETGGSLHLKPSNETIKPKKKKEKAVRKAPSLNSGTASSKADIFEAKVASAVNETNSSDSDETFVYESNPPESQSIRPTRFHSRTPSVTSTKSQIDHYGSKARQEGHHSIVGKKSMKFANNYNSIGYANDAEGIARGPHQSGRGTGNNTPHHHHIGRYGRGGHASILDSDSPFPNANKSATSHLGHVIPRHGSPRSPHVLHVTKSPRKAEEVLAYDLEGEGADDERAPLLNSIRTGRNRRRPLPGSVRQMYADDKGHRVCGRVTAFTTLGSVLVLLVAAIVAICVLCSKPLIDVRIKDIRNVIASEAELMLDLHVHAINPNIISVQVSDLDVNIFAKSKHVGTGEFWRSLPHYARKHQRNSSNQMHTSSRKPFAISALPSSIVHQLDGVDEGTDPIDDPAADSQTMLLGQIFEFDSPLIFDPSPFRHRSLGSIGEVRLSKPGNSTEQGGSERWEHVLNYDFELIVRGVLKYSSPISSKVHSAKIAGRRLIHPGEESGDGNNNITTMSKPLQSRRHVSLRPPRTGVVRLKFSA